MRLIPVLTFVACLWMPDALFAQEWTGIRQPARIVLPCSFPGQPAVTQTDPGPPSMVPYYPHVSTALNWAAAVIQ